MATEDFWLESHLRGYSPCAYNCWWDVAASFGPRRQHSWNVQVADAPGLLMRCGRCWRYLMATALLMEHFKKKKDVHCVHKWIIKEPCLLAVALVIFAASLISEWNAGRTWQRLIWWRRRFRGHSFGVYSIAGEVWLWLSHCTTLLVCCFVCDRTWWLLSVHAQSTQV